MLIRNSFSILCTRSAAKFEQIPSTCYRSPYVEARGSSTEVKDPCFGACSRHRGQASFFNLARFIKKG